MLKQDTITALLLLSLPRFLLAEPVTLGTVADNALGPTKILGNMVSVGCIVLGVALLLGSFIRYVEHKRNPVQTRLSTPICLFIFGIVLVLLPYIGSFSEATTALDNQHRFVGDASSAPVLSTEAQNARLDQEVRYERSEEDRRREAEEALLKQYESNQTTPPQSGTRR